MIDIKIGCIQTFALQNQKELPTPSCLRLPPFNVCAGTRLVTDLSQEAYDNNVCDFIGYEIKDSLRTKKKAIEEEDLVEEPELEKIQEQPITIIQ